MELQTVVDPAKAVTSAEDIGAKEAELIEPVAKKTGILLQIPKKNKSALKPMVAQSADPLATGSVFSEPSDHISFAKIVHQIENLNKGETIQRLGAAEKTYCQTELEMGCIMSRINRNGWYEPCASFDEWIETNTAFKRSKARALIQIYEVISASGVAWEKVDFIGWTKLRVVARVLTAENSKYWIGAAEHKTKAELEALVKKHDADNATPSTSEAELPKAITFRLQKEHIDALTVAIEKKKAASNVDADATALALICQKYVDEPTLEDQLTNLSIEALADLFSQVLGHFDEDAVLAILQAALVSIGLSAEKVHD